LILAVVFGVWAATSLRPEPGIFVAGQWVISFYAAVQGAVMLANLLVFEARRRRRDLYQITDWRILVTSGLRQRSTWSAYLDQLAEPVVRPDRGGVTNLVLRRAQAPAPRRGLAALVSQGPMFEIDDEHFPALLSLHDATTAEQTIAAARQEMLARRIGAVPPQAIISGVMVPGSVRIEADEQTLWAGRPTAAPWWFGLSDLNVSAFGLVFLAFAGLLCALFATYSPGALIFAVPFAVAGGGYPSIGRVLLRRLRIRRSTYVVTDRRIIATWQLAREPVVVQAPLGDLLPPELRDRSLILRPAATPQGTRGRGWDRATWPTTTTGPPSLIGLDNPGPVKDVICAAQLALRERRTSSPSA
jgi:hypothetical protein